MSQQYISTLSLWAVCWSMAVAGCAPQLELAGESGELAEKSQGGSPDPMAIYPVDKIHHYETGEAGLHERPVVSNAVAYARYAVEILGGWARDSEDPAEIARALAQIAYESPVQFDDALHYFNAEANVDEHEAFWALILADSRGMASSQMPRQGRELVDGRVRLNTCLSDGYGAVDCCATLAWFEGVYGASEMADTDESLRGGEDYRALTAEIVNAQMARVEAGESTGLRPFSQSGIKTWLGYCAGTVTGAPASLSDFVFQYGDYRNDGDWVVELHPISPAKQAGRRIYRRQGTDGLWVSVAESIEDNCSVRETEIIIRRENRQAEFLVFDHHGLRVEHAYFPTPRPNEDTVRFAPSTCMGCHYTFDTRKFNVPTPSFEALNLSFFEKNGEPVWRDHSGCADPQETLIYHDAPTISR